MFLFSIADIIQVPFGYLMGWLYQFTNNYGIALILFAVIVQLILLPMTAKSKKSMMKMSRLQPQMQDIQRRYADDPQRQNAAVQALYKEEGVSMGGGCPVESRPDADYPSTVYRGAPAPCLYAP